jgi:hypothetical protein
MMMRHDAHRRGGTAPQPFIPPKSHAFPITHGIHDLRLRRHGHRRGALARQELAGVLLMDDPFNGTGLIRIATPYDHYLT